MHRLVMMACCVFLISSPLMAQTAREVAQARLIYLDGQYSEAMTILQPAAEAGNANAQNLMGNAHMNGNGVELDAQKALDWWQKAAAQGFIKAVYNLGWGYENGRFPEGINIAKALQHYEQAAAVGYVHANNNLGYMYETGSATGEPDYDKAAEYYQRAVDQGLSRAMNNLGQFYIYATGVEEDVSKAMEMFLMAANQGDAAALGNIGAMYGNGYDVAMDRYAAMGLYESAARRGHAQSAINLAYQNILFEGGYFDPATGWGWCLVGIDLSSGVTKENRVEECEGLGADLSAETKAQGDRIAQNLMGEIQ